MVSLKNIAIWLTFAGRPREFGSERRFQQRTHLGLEQFELNTYHNMDTVFACHWCHILDTFTSRPSHISARQLLLCHNISRNKSAPCCILRNMITSINLALISIVFNQYYSEVLFWVQLTILFVIIRGNICCVPDVRSLWKVYICFCINPS